MSRLNSRKHSALQIFFLACISCALGLFVWAPVFGQSTTSGWLPALIIAAVFSIPGVLLAAALLSKCSGENIFALSGRSLGKAPARLVLALLSVIFIVRASLIMTVQTDAISLYLLERTPAPVTAAALALAASCAAAGGASRLARTSELLSLVIIPPLLILFVAALMRMDFGELLYLRQPDMSDSPVLLLPAAMTFAGLDCLPFLPQISSPSARKPVFFGFLTVFAVSAVSYFAAAGLLTADGLAPLRFPLTETARIITIGGVAISERFDLLLMFIRLIAVIIQLAILFCCSGGCLTYSLRCGSHSAFVWLSAAVSVILSLLLNESQRELGLFSVWSAAAISLVFIPLLLILSGRKPADDDAPSSVESR